MIGWRQWAVDPRGRLRPAWTPWSPYPDDLLLWRPDGLTKAHCLRARRPSVEAPLAWFAPAVPTRQDDRAPDHWPMPDEACDCGLYAWRTPDLLAAAPRPRWTRLPIVVGAVRLGGRVIVTERGYRAQFAHPLAVRDPSGVVSPDYPIARYRRLDALVAEWYQPESEEPRADRS